VKGMPPRGKRNVNPPGSKGGPGSGPGPGHNPPGHGPGR
jgi:hypothetical protein